MKGEKNKSIGNIVFVLALIILIPILIFNLCIVYQAKTKKDVVPSVFGYKPFIVLSGSMETKIHVGDLIITKVVDAKTLSKNDVIAFRDAENTVTTHRIIDIVEKDGETYFITKGDNNDSQDQNLVELNDVEGIYVTRIPGIGTMLNELSKPTTILIVVLGVSIIFILLFQISNKKLKITEEKEYEEFKKFKEQQKLNAEKDKNTSNKTSKSKQKSNSSKHS